MNAHEAGNDVNDVPNIDEVMDDRVINAIAKATAHREMPNYNEMIYTLVDNVKRELMEILGQIKSNDKNINLNAITTIDPEKLRTITEYIPNELSNIINIEFCNKKYELILNDTDKIYYVKFTIKLPQRLKKSTSISETTKINNYTTLLTNIIVYLYLKQNIIFNNDNDNDHITNLIPFGIYSSYIGTKTVQVGSNNAGYRFVPTDEIQNNLYNYGLPTNSLVKNNTKIQQSFCINSFSKFLYTNIFNYNIELDITIARVFVKDNILRYGGVYIIIQTNEIIRKKNWQDKLDELYLDGDDTDSKIAKIISDGSLDNIYNIIGEVLFTNITDINKKRKYSKIVSHICSQQLFVVYLKLLLNEIYELYFPSPVNYDADEKKHYILYNYDEDIIIIKRSFIITCVIDNSIQKKGTNDMIIIYNFATDQLFITMDIQNDHFTIDFTNKLALLSQPKVFFLNTQPQSGPVHLTTHGSHHSGTKKKSIPRRNSTGQFPSNRARSSSIRRLKPQTSI